MSACTTPGKASTRSSEPDACTFPAGSGPGSAVRKRIASGCEKRGTGQLVGHVLAECLRAARPRPGRRPTAWRDEVGHLPARDPRGHLDDRAPPVVGDDQLRERDPVAEPERAARPARRRARPARAVAVDRRRDRRGSSRRRSRCPGGRSRSESVRSIASPPRASTRPLSSRPSTNSRRSPPPSTTPRARRAGARRGRRRESRRKTPRWPPESAGLSTAGRPTVSAAARCLEDVANGGEARLRHTRLGEAATHRDLVRHQVRGRRADPGQTEPLGHRGHDGHGAVGRDGQHAVDGVPPADLGNCVDVLEVDDLRHVGLLRARARRGCGRRRRRGGRAPAPAIARRWCRPAPTKRTVFTAGARLRSRGRRYRHGRRRRCPAPLPQEIVSRAPSRAWMSSAPAPASTRSRPPRGSMMSRAAVPLIVSLRTVPKIRQSLPVRR